MHLHNVLEEQQIFNTWESVLTKVSTEKQQQQQRQQQGQLTNEQISTNNARVRNISTTRPTRARRMRINEALQRNYGTELISDACWDWRDCYMHNNAIDKG